jgi:hypothetical protein
VLIDLLLLPHAVRYGDGEERTIVSMLEEIRLAESNQDKSEE